MGPTIRDQRAGGEDSAGDRAQSETVGVVLLTGVVVILVAIVGAVVLGDLGSEKPPVADFEPNVTTGAVTLQYTNGDRIQKTDLTVVVIGADRARHGLETYTELAGNGDDSLDPGERVRRTHTIGQETVRVIVVHEPTGETVYGREVDVSG